MTYRDYLRLSCEAEQMYWDSPRHPEHWLRKAQEWLNAANAAPSRFEITHA